MAKFSNNFWGSEFCSTTGYDHLVKRLKEGKRTCHDFEEVIEKRIRIEREYGDSLVKLAEKASGKDEIGTLKKAWDQLKSETDAIGKLHLSMSQKLSEDILKAVREFKDQQRDTRKKSEDTVKRAAGHKRQCYTATNRVRNVYEQRCRDADKAEDTYNKQQSAPNTKPQDLIKGQKNAEKARTQSKNADQTYLETVKNLEEARALWEREMELLCRQFQELEEQRISYLRHQMWTFCNMCSQTTVYEDQSYENVRKSLEDCNVDKDIDTFVNERKTGSDRPAPVPYVNYYQPAQIVPEPTTGKGGGRTEGGIPIREAPNKELPPIPVEVDTARDMYSSIPEQLKPNTTVPVGGMEEGYYASPKAHFGKVVAMYSYDAQGTQELNIEEGSIVDVVAKEDDVWWCGQLDGKTGMFPAAYVEPYNDV